MFDLKIPVSDQLAQLLLGRLDRLIEILEYRFPTPERAKVVRSEVPVRTGGTLTVVTGEDRYNQELAEMILLERLGRQPTSEEVDVEILERRSYGG